MLMVGDGLLGGLQTKKLIQAFVQLFHSREAIADCPQCWCGWCLPFFELVKLLLDFESGRMGSGRQANWSNVAPVSHCSCSFTESSNLRWLLQCLQFSIYNNHTHRLKQDRTNNVMWMACGASLGFPFIFFFCHSFGLQRSHKLPIFNLKKVLGVLPFWCVMQKDKMVISLLPP